MVDPPSVSLSFANNFWGKDDAGVSPVLERMHSAKVTGDELKSFYTSRAAIEDEYARKLLSLARKPLGSSEAGTLRMSLDVIRAEVESMGKSHQNIAAQMKGELEEPLAAFTGGMKERRKIVQGGLEKLLKVKTQQTTAVNKTRDRYEQDCLKIKGYLAQGHMVMGQEERKNKAKLEKTQVQLSTTSNEYEAAVKALEETTGKWNRDWKAGCDKFQDLEEERIDFMKSSLWSFANIASTVCVTDDASCEKVRLSLEDCDVEKDIMSFIKECGTGQEIPDPPKFINFCRGDINDAASEVSDDGNYSVAQFQRTTNPAFRSSSPQPSTIGSHRDLRSDVGDNQMENAYPGPASVVSCTQRKPAPAQIPPPQSQPPKAQNSYQYPQKDDLPEVPHNEYPMDGMTQFCRLGPPSERSSVASPQRPASRDSQSEYSNPTSFSSQEPSLGSRSPTKQMNDFNSSQLSGDEVHKKRSGFFQNRSPFRRKSKSEKERPQQTTVVPPPNAQGWTTGGGSQVSTGASSPTRSTRHYGQNSQSSNKYTNRPSPSPEPTDPRASFQLNVGNNVFDVASPDVSRALISTSTNPQDDLDPIAQALAVLKGLGKQSSVRAPAERYHGNSNQGSGGGDASSNVPLNRNPIGMSQRASTYNQPPVSRLGAPQPAFTSRQMQQTTQRYIDSGKNMFNPQSGYDQRQPPSSRSAPNSRPGTQGSGIGEPQNRATSPIPMRSTSPRPGLYEQQQRQGYPRATSPNPQMMDGAQSSQPRPRAQSSSPIKGRGDSYGNRGPGVISPGHGMPRATSPQPLSNRPPNERPTSRNEMAMQLAPVNSNGYAPQQSQPRGRPMAQQGGARPVSQYAGGLQSSSGPEARTRSKSVADGRQLTKDGIPILHYSRAMYVYQAAIKEELSFAKGDVLAVLHHQDDGWWEAELVGSRGMRGLVPSNYLVDC